MNCTASIPTTRATAPATGGGAGAHRQRASLCHDVCVCFCAQGIGWSAVSEAEWDWGENLSLSEGVARRALPEAGCRSAERCFPSGHVSGFDCQRWTPAATRVYTRFPGQHPTLDPAPTASQPFHTQVRLRPGSPPGGSRGACWPEGSNAALRRLQVVGARGQGRAGKQQRHRHLSSALAGFYANQDR